jgi:hypothetical protein
MFIALSFEARKLNQFEEICISFVSVVILGENPLGFEGRGSREWKDITKLDPLPSPHCGSPRMTARMTTPSAQD